MRTIDLIQRKNVPRPPVFERIESLIFSFISGLLLTRALILSQIISHLNVATFPILSCHEINLAVILLANRDLIASGHQFVIKGILKKEGPQIVLGIALD